MKGLSDNRERDMNSNCSLDARYRLLAIGTESKRHFVTGSTIEVINLSTPRSEVRSVCLDSKWFHFQDSYYESRD